LIMMTAVEAAKTLNKSNETLASTANPYPTVSWRPLPAPRSIIGRTKSGSSPRFLDETHPCPIAPHDPGGDSHAAVTVTWVVVARVPVVSWNEEHTRVMLAMWFCVVATPLGSRTQLGWLSRFRRIARDYGQLSKTLADLHLVAFPMPMAHRVGTLMADNS
jgi:hypothetical protein